MSRSPRPPSGAGVRAAPGKSARPGGGRPSPLGSAGMPEERGGLPPHPNPLPRGRGSRTVLATAGQAIRAGAWGLLRSGREETSHGPQGGWGARAAQRARPGTIRGPGGWARAARSAARSSGMGVWGAQPPAGDARSPSEGAGPPSGSRACGGPLGGVGAQPPQKEHPRAGGRARAAQRARPGLGVWGAQPPAGDARSPSEGAGPPSGTGPLGGVGAQPPQKEHPRAGGRARAAQRARPGWGCGGLRPPQGGGKRGVSCARPGRRRRRGRARRPR